MSLPNQISAYPDCFELFDRAAASTKGARALLPDKSKAMLFQMRMHQARSLQRAETRRMYDKSSPQYDKSEFDHLRVSVQEDSTGGWWVYVIPHGTMIETIEEIE